MWGGQFYGNPAADAEDDAMKPGSVAGTFGVTGMDNGGTPDDTEDDVTRSWIGAFGAKNTARRSKSKTPPASGLNSPGAQGE